MNVIKLSGVELSPEIFGDKVIKRNTWAGTGYEHAMYTVLRRPVPPWARERLGPKILETEYPNIARVNSLFAEAASKATVQALHNAGLSHKQFLKYRAKFIGKYVKTGGNVSIADILPAKKREVMPTAQIGHIEF